MSVAIIYVCILQKSSSTISFVCWKIRKVFLIIFAIYKRYHVHFDVTENSKDFFRIYYVVPMFRSEKPNRQVLSSVVIEIHITHIIPMLWSCRRKVNSTQPWHVNPNLVWIVGRKVFAKGGFDNDDTKHALQKVSISLFAMVQ